MVEFQNISVGSKVWYWVEATDKLEEAKVKAIYIVENDPTGTNSYVAIGGKRLFVKGYGKEWFVSIEKASAEMARVHSHSVNFGDTVEFLPTHEQGIVYNVCYKQNNDWAIVPTFNVAFEDKFKENIKENELERIGNAFSKLRQAFESGVKNGKEEVKNTIIHLLSDTPKFKHKHLIPKKAIIGMFEDICKN